MAVLKNINYVEAIRTNFDSLGAKKRKIAEFVLKNPMKVISASGQELASLCNCEQSTIVRFAQQLGFSGVTELKIAVARQANMVWGDFEGAAQTDAGGNVLEQLIRLHCESIAGTLRSLNLSMLESLLEKLETAPLIMTAGAGSSQLAAQDLAIKLTRLGLRCMNYSDAEFSKTFLGYLCDGGVLILFSHSGTTPTMLTLAENAKREQIALASVTSFPDSPIAGLSDWRFSTECGHEHPIRFGVMTGRIAQFAVVDAIALLFSLRDRERSWKNIVKGYLDEKLQSE